MKKVIHKAAFYSAIIILAAQFSMNLFITDFKISIGVVCFSSLLFLTEGFPLLPVTCISAAGVSLSRLLFYWFKHGCLDNMYFSYMPERSFYICYGLLLFLYTRICPGWRKLKNRSLPVLSLIDYISNVSELFFRTGSDALNLRTQTGILLVAVLRALIIWCILTIFERYRLFLLKQEHEERYKRLLLLVSRLNGEIVWMKKNTILIEETMNTTYCLYKELKNTDASDTLSASALDISRDIHEIKKEYLLIMRGISEALDQEFESDGMYLEEILQILKNSMLLTAREQEKNLHISYSLTHNPYTKQHYALMSVFRNLFMNALEAGTETPVCINVTESEKDGHYIITVTDNGPGVPAENMSDIFKAGYSTKINYTTGEVNRGLGLNLVKDLIETQLQGSVSLTSSPGQTTFTIKIPVNQTM